MRKRSDPPLLFGIDLEHSIFPPLAQKRKGPPCRLEWAEVLRVEEERGGRRGEGRSTCTNQSSSSGAKAPLPILHALGTNHTFEMNGAKEGQNGLVLLANVGP